MHDLMADRKKVELVNDYEKILSRSLKHVFELLALIYPPENIMKAYQNLSGGTAAYSIELLDNILRKDIREFLLPIIDEIPFEDKVKKCRRLIKGLEKMEKKELAWSFFIVDIIILTRLKLMPTLFVYPKKSEAFRFSLKEDKVSIGSRWSWFRRKEGPLPGF